MSVLIIGQIIVSILLIVFILIQQRGTALGAGFGGGGSEFYAKKRGPEKTFFWITIVLAVLFVGLSILNLVV